MSTSNSVGRLTATNEKVRLTATQENGRSAATFKKDRSRLCAFTFADGRQCRTPRRSGHQHLCYYHAKKEAEALIAKQAGEDLASLFCGKNLSAPDFAAALGLPDDPLKATEAILRGNPRFVDLVRVRTAEGRARLYAGGGGIGLDAEAARYASGVYRRLPGRSTSDRAGSPMRCPSWP